MFKKRLILNQLNRLEFLYSQASTNNDDEHQKYYSKLAVLECSGWVEETMDEIIKKCVTKRRVRKQNVLDSIKYVIDKNYSFEYQNLKRMLSRVIGIIEFYRIEEKIDDIKLFTFKNSLHTLKVLRDEYAHTYILNTTSTFYAPSWTKNSFNGIYQGLSEFYNKV